MKPPRTNSPLRPFRPFDPNPPSRCILHLDQDSFFVSVERLQNSSLKEKPVIVGGMGDRGVVSSCSYEARRFGVHSAMPVRMARQRCPHGIFIRGDMEQYTRYSDLVTEIIAQKAPLFEKASIDEHYLDITGMDRFFGCHQWASEMRQTLIKETGLPISMGLSLNKTVAKVATGESKPDGQMAVEAAMIQPFLDPLSIRKIPMVGPKAYERLRQMGIATIQTLRQVPPGVLEAVMGKNGHEIWRRANGIDHSPVLAWSEQKSMGTETTFAQDTIDVARILTQLAGMCEQLAFRLRHQEKLCGSITVKIRYANFDTHTLRQQIPAYTAFDHVLIPLCKELFQRLYTRRMRIRLVGIQLGRLVRGVQQLNMFEDSPSSVRLYQAMDRMRKKHGAHIIVRAESNRPC